MTGLLPLRNQCNHYWVNGLKDLTIYKENSLIAWHISKPATCQDFRKTMSYRHQHRRLSHSQYPTKSFWSPFSCHCNKDLIVSINGELLYHTTTGISLYTHEPSQWNDAKCAAQMDRASVVQWNAYLQIIILFVQEQLLKWC